MKESKQLSEESIIGFIHLAIKDAGNSSTAIRARLAYKYKIDLSEKELSSYMDKMFSESGYNSIADRFTGNNSTASNHNQIADNLKDKNPEFDKAYEKVSANYPHNKIADNLRD